MWTWALGSQPTTGLPHADPSSEALCLAEDAFYPRMEDAFLRMEEQHRFSPQDLLCDSR